MGSVIIKYPNNPYSRHKVKLQNKSKSGFIMVAFLKLDIG